MKGLVGVARIEEPESDELEGEVQDAAGDGDAVADTEPATDASADSSENDEA